MNKAQVVIVERLFQGMINDRVVANKAIAAKFDPARMPVSIRSEVEQRTDEIDAMQATITLLNEA